MFLSPASIPRSIATDEREPDGFEASSSAPVNLRREVRPCINNGVESVRRGDAADGWGNADFS